MSFLGGLIGGITGFITGGPAGAVIGAVGGATAGSAAGAVSAGYRPTTTGAGGLSSAALPSAAPNPGGFFGADAYRRYFASQPGGVTSKLPAVPFSASPMGGTGVTAGETADLPTGAPVDCNIRGHHLNKSRYYTKGKYAVFGTEIVPHDKGTVCVKNRRMNVGNAKALRHALRRAYGFEKLAMRTIRLIHPKKHGQFGGFKKKTSSRR